MLLFSKESLISHLKRAAPDHLAPAYLFILDDSTTKKELLDELKALFPAPMNHAVTLDGEHLFQGDLQRALCPSLFVSMNIVLINRFHLVSSEVKDSLLKQLSHPSHSLIVLFADSVKKTTTFYKEFEKLGIVFEAQKKKPWELAGSLAQEVAHFFSKRGKKIDKRALEMLVERTNQNRDLLFKELEKLDCFLDEGETLQKEDISLLCPDQSLATVFALHDALIARSLESALTKARQIVQDPSLIILTLRSLRTQFSTLFEISHLATMPDGDSLIQASYPYLKGRLLEQKKASARSFSRASLKKALFLIDTAEFQAKNSRIETSLLIDTLILKLIHC